MTSEQVQKNRKTIRLQDYDYDQPGMYFVTICSQDKVCLFGEIIDYEMVLNDFGKIVKDVWNEISQHFPDVELDAFVVMPNHVHGIIAIIDEIQSNDVDTRNDDSLVRARHASPLRNSPPR